MFDTITAPRAKRRAGTSMAVSILLHVAVVAAAFLLAYARAHMPRTTEVEVPVAFRPPPANVFAKKSPLFHSGRAPFAAARARRRFVSA